MSRLAANRQAPDSSTDRSYDLGWIDKLEYSLLRRFVRSEPLMDGTTYKDTSKLAVLLGQQFVESLRGKVVIDFGCGEGREAVDMVRAGAARVIGLDYRESCVQASRALARREGVADRCEFMTDGASVQADVVVSLDSFEHFEDPGEIMSVMFGLLRPGGKVLTSFGPTWYHPLGGHLFSVFPWAHLVLTERALIRWRSDIRDDGAQRFGEVDGGLNQMTIRRFERYAHASAFDVEAIQPVPIRKLRWLHSHLTREFTSAVVRAELRKPEGADR